MECIVEEVSLELSSFTSFIRQDHDHAAQGDDDQDQDHHDQGDSTSDPMECIVEEVNNKEAFPVMSLVPPSLSPSPSPSPSQSTL